MRIRSTKPEFWRSKTIAQLEWADRFVLKGLESYVDDNGVGKDDLALIAADVFPRDLSASPRDTLARLSEAISRLHSGGLIARYAIEGESLLYIDRWKSIQRIDKPGRGRFRRPDGTLEYDEEVNRESYASPREGVASPPVVLAPGAVEQWNRGTGEQEELHRPTTSSDAFDTFWSVYPRKDAKRKAEGAFRAALKRADAQTITAGAQRYADDPNREAAFTAMAASWLNADRWGDGPLPDQRAVSIRDRPSTTDQRVQSAEALKAHFAQAPRPQLGA